MNFALFGNPVAHSLSPRIHNAAFREFGAQIGFIGQYSAIKKSAHNIKSAILEFDGANITAPLKEVAFELVETSCETSKVTKSVNTIVHKDGLLRGFNTDVGGFLESIKNLEFKNALVLGSGSTARCIQYALKNLGISTRMLSRKSELESGFVFEMIINATSTQEPDFKQLPLWLSKALFVYDVNYSNNHFLESAKKINSKIHAQNGLLMLIHQAALSFEIWSESFGRKINSKQVAEFMKKELRC